MSLNPDPLVSIILPVYNRLRYLKQAIDSVFAQTYSNWELILADDASDMATQDFLEQYISIPKVKVYFNTQNLGLFANLNRAISRSNGSYILLLCSDDFLLPNGIKTGLTLLQNNPEAELLLSAFEMTDSESQILTSRSIDYYARLMTQPIQLLKKTEILPLLLQHGSINGNLTGIFFARSLYSQVGGFKEEFRQVADWEWIYQVARKHSVLMSKTSIATVRSHPEQLSGVNFKNLTNSLEVVGMVQLLMHDPYISQLKDCPCWALHLMQFQLWFALKFALQGQWSEAITLSRAIDQVTGFSSTFWAMLKWLPQRWQVYQQKSFPIPPADQPG
jgi:glycosyltransferase involved in cell wall biosynthesis